MGLKKPRISIPIDIVRILQTVFLPISDFLGFTGCQSQGQIRNVQKTSPNAIRMPHFSCLSASIITRSCSRVDPVDRNRRTSERSAKYGPDYDQKWRPSFSIAQSSVTHPLVDPTKLCIPMSDRWLPQRMVASTKCEEPRTFAKCQFIKCEAIKNDVDIVQDSNLDKCTTHILFDENLFHVVKNALNEHCHRIIMIKRSLRLIFSLRILKRLRSRHWKIFVV
jgi:hypothetical protein